MGQRGLGVLPNQGGASSPRPLRGTFAYLRTCASSALLTYRAAWLRDCVGTAPGPEAQAYTAAAAMAKMTATENAQRVIDMALQMHGGMGVKVGTKVESLYRDIRSLRIYEGATEVQQLIIGKSVLKG